MSKSTIKDIATKLSTMPQALAKIDELSKELSAKDTSISDLTAEVADLRKTVEGNLEKQALLEQEKETLAKAPTNALAKLTAEFEGKLAAQKTEFEGTIKTLTEKVKETETSVNAKVANELVTIGVSVPEIKEQITSESAQNLFKQFKALQGAEQYKFYQLHKAELLAVGKDERQ
jgi:uncharacterized protein (DUF342 family)